MVFHVIIILELMRLSICCLGCSQDELGDLKGKDNDTKFLQLVYYNVFIYFFIRLIEDK